CRSGGKILTGNILSYLMWCIRANGLLRLSGGGLVMSNIPASLLENCSDAGIQYISNKIGRYYLLVKEEF
ncbi:TPA: hypothetical protein ACTUNV_003321, partial [Legionella pneumophila]